MRRIWFGEMCFHCGVDTLPNLSEYRLNYCGNLLFAHVLTCISIDPLYSTKYNMQQISISVNKHQAFSPCDGWLILCNTMINSSQDLYIIVKRKAVIIFCMWNFCSKCSLFVAYFSISNNFSDKLCKKLHLTATTIQTLSWFLPNWTKQ